MSRQAVASSPTGQEMNRPLMGSTEDVVTTQYGTAAASNTADDADEHQALIIGDVNQPNGSVAYSEGHECGLDEGRGPVESVCDHVDEDEIYGGALANEDPHHHTGHYETEEEEKAHDVVTYRRAILATIPLFMGYAGTVTLQRNIKERIGIKDGGNHESYVFGIAVSFVYVGNLIFRLMHNVLFTFLTPRRRVMLAYTLMMLSQGLIAVVYWVFDSKSLVWMFFAYLFAGVAIGTYESNLMSCITPLGHGTKSWAVIGIPIGFNGVSVGCFLLFAVFPNNPWLEGGAYVFICLSNLFGLIFFTFTIPHVEFEASHDNVKKFFADLLVVRRWFPVIWKHCFALMIDMFGVSLFSSVAYYIYDSSELPLWPYSDTRVPKNAFQTVYNLCAFLGDFSARKIAYRDKARNPFIFVIFTIVGFGLVLSKTALVAPLGMFCIMFANGSIYAQTTKHVDNAVDDRFNLMALSVWLFVGDIGSVAGAQLVTPIRSLVGKVPGAEVHDAVNTTVAPAAADVAQHAMAMLGQFWSD